MHENPFFPRGSSLKGHNNKTYLKTKSLSLGSAKPRTQNPGLNQYNRRGLKGQTEIIIVLGVIIVSVIGVLFATRTVSLLPPEPASVSVLKASLRADIERAVSAGTIAAVKAVAANGGYLNLDSDPKPPTLDYLGNKVAFWQYANLTITRERQDFESAISKGLKENLQKIDPKSFKGLEGKNVEIQSPRNIEVKIGQKDISVKVDMPVYLEGYGFDSPIQVKINSRLGSAIDFANQLIGKSQKKELQYRESDEQGSPTNKVLGVVENRYFERFTADAIRAYSDVDIYGNPKIPSEGILTDCAAPSINKDWFQIKPEMENLIEGILENTYTAGKVPVGITNRSQYPAYAVPVFTDLDVKFNLGKSLDEKSFQIYQNNSIDPSKVIVNVEHLPYSATCLSPPYRVLYFLFYPVVTEVGDENFKLKFAFHTYLNGYQPGDWNDLGIALDSFEEALRRCSTASCPAKITVLDGAGAVEDAEISYSYCRLGRTDRLGTLETNVPCGISMLQVSDKDHKPFNALLGSDSIKEATIFLSKIGPINLHIYNVEFYLDRINNTFAYKVSDVRPNAEKFTLAINGLDQPPVFVESTKSDEQTALIPTNQYVVFSTIVQRGETNLGGFDAFSVIPEGTTDIYLYNPVLKNGIPQNPIPNPGVKDDQANFNANAQNLDTITLIRAALTNVTIQCGRQAGAILPFGSSPANLTRVKGCVV